MPELLASELTREHAAELLRIEDDELRRLRAIHEQARKEVLGRLAEVRADTFTAQQLRSVQVQIEGGIRSMTKKLEGHAASQVDALIEQGIAQTVAEIAYWEPKFRGGATQRIQAAAARRVLKPRALLLHQYESSVQAYGLNLIGETQRRLGVHLVKNSSWRDMSLDIAGRLEANAIQGARWRAERIVRTEAVNALSLGNYTALEETEELLPGLAGQWDATVDKRSSHICLELNGRVRRIGEPFGTYNGRPIMRPPAIPNCRSRVLPWHRDWAELDETIKPEEAPKPVVRERAPAPKPVTKTEAKEQVWKAHDAVVQAVLSGATPTAAQTEALAGAARTLFRFEGLSGQSLDAAVAKRIAGALKEAQKKLTPVRAKALKELQAAEKTWIDAYIEAGGQVSSIPVRLEDQLYNAAAHLGKLEGATPEEFASARIAAAAKQAKDAHQAQVTVAKAAVADARAGFVAAHKVPGIPDAKDLNAALSTLAKLEGKKGPAAIDFHKAELDAAKKAGAKVRQEAVQVLEAEAGKAKASYQMVIEDSLDWNDQIGFARTNLQKKLKAVADLAADVEGDANAWIAGEVKAAENLGKSGVVEKAKSTADAYVQALVSGDLDAAGTLETKYVGLRTWFGRLAGEEDPVGAAKYALGGLQTTADALKEKAAIEAEANALKAPLKTLVTTKGTKTDWISAAQKLSDAEHFDDAMKLLGADPQTIKAQVANVLADWVEDLSKTYKALLIEDVSDKAAAEYALELALSKTVKSDQAVKAYIKAIQQEAAEQIAKVSQQKLKDFAATLAAYDDAATGSLAEKGFAKKLLEQPDEVIAAHFKNWSAEEIKDWKLGISEVLKESPSAEIAKGMKLADAGFDIQAVEDALDVSALNVNSAKLLVEATDEQLAEAFYETGLNPFALKKKAQKILGNLPDFEAPAPAVALKPYPKKQSGAPGEITLPSGKKASYQKGSPGSNPGGFYRTTDGEDWFVKFPPSTGQVSAEHVSADLARQMGLKTKDYVAFMPDDAHVAIASPKASFKQLGGSEISGWKSREELADHFVHAAWTRNWDVVGLGFDNLVVSQGGDLMVVDYGGSFLWRAQGALKTDGMPKIVAELKSLRDTSVNPQTAKAFASLTDKDIAKAVKAKLSDLDDDEIIAAVARGNFAPDDAAKITSGLLERKQWLDEWADDILGLGGKGGPDEVKKALLGHLPNDADVGIAWKAGASADAKERYRKALGGDVESLVKLGRRLWAGTPQMEQNQELALRFLQTAWQYDKAAVKAELGQWTQTMTDVLAALESKAEGQLSVKAVQKEIERQAKLRAAKEAKEAAEAAKKAAEAKAKWAAKKAQFTAAKATYDTEIAEWEKKKAAFGDAVKEALGKRKTTTGLLTKAFEKKVNAWTEKLEAGLARLDPETQAQFTAAKTKLAKAAEDQRPWLEKVAEYRSIAARKRDLGDGYTADYYERRALKLQRKTDRILAHAKAAYADEIEPVAAKAKLFRVKAEAPGARPQPPEGLFEAAVPKTQHLKEQPSRSQWVEMAQEAARRAGVDYNDAYEMMRYYSDGGYSRLRQAQRGKTYSGEPLTSASDLQSKRRMDNLAAMLREMPGYESPGTAPNRQYTTHKETFRSNEDRANFIKMLDHAIESGEPLPPWGAITSGSSHDQWHGNLHYRIYGKVTATPIDAVSSNSGEKEVFLLPEMRVQVRKWYEQGGTMIVECEEYH